MKSLKISIVVASLMCGVFAFLGGMPISCAQGFRPELALQTGHSSSVRAAAFSPDGRLIATGGSDSMIKVWIAQTGEVLYSLSGGSGGISSLTYSKDGAWLYSATFGGELLMWDARRGTLHRTLSGIGRKFTRAIVPSSDGKWLATAGDGNALRVWDAQTGESVRSFDTGLFDVEGLCFSPDSRRVALYGWIVTGQDNKSSTLGARVMDVTTGTLIWSSTLEWEHYSGIVFAGNSDRLATLRTQVGQDERNNIFSIVDLPTGQTIKEKVEKVSNPEYDNLWSNSSGNKIVTHRGNEILTLKMATLESGQVFSGHVDSIQAADFSQDGSTLLTASDDGTAKLWNLQNGELKRTLSGYSGAVSSVAYQQNSETIYAAYDNGVIRIWDTRTGELRRMLRGACSSLTSLLLSTDGNTLVAGGATPLEQKNEWREVSGAVEFWDTRTGLLKRTLKNLGDNVESIQYDSTGKRLIASAVVKSEPIMQVGMERVLLDASGNIVKKLAEVDPASGGYFSNDVAFSPDGKWIISSTIRKDGEKILTDLKLLDAQNGEPIRLIATTENSFLNLEFIQGGKLLAGIAGSAVGFEGDNIVPEVHFWNTQTGTIQQAIKPTKDLINYLKFTPDGKKVAIFQSNWHDDNWNSFMRIHDVDSGQLLEEKNEGILPQEFAPDSKFTVEESAGILEIKDPVTGQTQRKLQGHSGVITTYLITDDEKQIVSGGADGTVRLWNAVSGKQVAAFVSLPATEGEDISSDWLTVTNEGFYDGSAGSGRVIKWRVNQDLYPLEAYETALHRPDLVKKSLSGEATGQTTLLAQFNAGQAIPPQVRFLSPTTGAQVNGDELSIEVEATDDRAVERAEILVNGRPVPAKPIASASKDLDKTLMVQGKDQPNASSTAHRIRRTFAFNVPLSKEEANLTIKAIVRDPEGLEGWSEIQVVHPSKVNAANDGNIATLPPAIGNLYVLAVGVSDYQQKQLNLKYARQDAEAFTQLWPTMQGRLYKKVIVTTLANAEATTANIRASLFKLLENVTDKDNVVLFLSGHGVLDQTPTGDNYYFASYDVNPQDIANSALPWTVFQTTLAKVDARRILLFLDACHSGNGLGDKQTSSERLGELLAKRAGVTVFSSSRGSELSYELDELRHGAFTAALIEGIGGGKADLNIGGGQDGIINVEELMTFLRARVGQLTQNRQTPTVPLLRDFGEPFPIAQVAQ